MRSKGLISSTLFCEIKTHETELLARNSYRAGVYQASKELGGGVAQVQKTALRAQQLISGEFLTQIYEKDGNPTVPLPNTSSMQVGWTFDVECGCSSRRRRAVATSAT